MTTLIIGFIALVLVPALLLSLILARVMNRRPEFGMHDEHSRFTISTDS